MVNRIIPDAMELSLLIRSGFKEKPIGWCGSSLDDLRAFPEIARAEAGYQLRKLQRGEPPDKMIDAVHHASRHAVKRRGA